MVVAPLTLSSLAVATLFIAALPFLIYRRLRRPLALNPRDAITGIAVFALFAMVIERALNDYVLHRNEATATFLSNPLAFVVYGALAAGICEEVGRFIGMRLLLKRAAAKSASAAGTGDGTALTYGLGHGGAEAWLVGVLVQIQWILFAIFENRGELDGYLSNLPTDSVMRIHLILASLTPQTAGIFALERVAALVFQIGLSVLMWRGLRAGWRGILPLAIVLHALVDVPAALFQAQLVPLAAVDGVYALGAVIVAGLLFRAFRRPALAA
ncbi:MULTISPECIES: YhfC family intramembrane metalloprotease [Paraburkholderia]|uniref:YhfC family intramembrane metalloprotease n=1 Tax=Paraburkholderia madseniana TaxID=2599607 RepID=A0A6N6WC36_9BURK|nr:MULTISPECIES: YhfC family intramembrane metalloprotease [Paraburkholderia]KAE8757080.1 YhfC family intramembrane metalloprotease [Paraburkholderia madseniana]MCX4175299.1 YhfC family intramembrane metalloprotease [Paraburkholderia madseniana]MDQ6463298.1 YhfC family intramembrane metalloprotease [Paraburkholderia madseniana]